MNAAHLFLAAASAIMLAACSAGVVDAVDMRRYNWAALLAALAGALVAVILAVGLRLIAGE